MISNREAALFQTSDAAKPASWPGWGVLIPAILVSNILLAIFAWFVVEWAMTLI
jgi:hypothetical protein